MMYLNQWPFTLNTHHTYIFLLFKLHSTMGGKWLGGGQEYSTVIGSKVTSLGRRRCINVQTVTVERIYIVLALFSCLEVQADEHFLV